MPAATPASPASAMRPSASRTPSRRPPTAASSTTSTMISMTATMAVSSCVAGNVASAYCRRGRSRPAMNKMDR